MTLCVCGHREDIHARDTTVGPIDTPCCFFWFEGSNLRRECPCDRFEPSNVEDANG